MFTSIALPSLHHFKVSNLPLQSEPSYHQLRSIAATAVLAFAAPFVVHLVLIVDHLVAQHQVEHSECRQMALIAVLIAFVMLQASVVFV